MALKTMHQMFLQSLMSHQLASEESLKLIQKECCKIERSAESFSTTLGICKAALNKLGLDIKSFKTEDTGKPVYAIVNKTNDEEAQLGTAYSKKEIEYFHQVLTMLMESQNRHVDSMTLHHLGGELSGDVGSLSMLECERVCQRLCKDGWLVRFRNTGSLTFGPRTHLELLSYLKEAFPDQILKCAVCHLGVLFGQACMHEACIGQVHVHCLRRFAQNQPDGELRCPACNQGWLNDTAWIDQHMEQTDYDAVIEEPEDNDDNDGAATQTPETQTNGAATVTARRQNGKRTRTKTRRIEDDDDDDDDDINGQDDEIEDTLASRRARRRSKRA
eukprot:TRINITY_DN12057_c1_g4_i1.p1 TRINITY_DN12057_c1_g4~~TRINITY_DN12057_c1_g4_i1.p1  ORF type:complete len:347 (+),score=82.06 TRINITY_DN12057_c1_g4_i1:51-1043(+)